MQLIVISVPVDKQSLTSEEYLFWDVVSVSSGR
jgi:hypothetical protein